MISIYILGELFLYVMVYSMVIRSYILALNKIPHNEVQLSRILKILPINVWKIRVVDPEHMIFVSILHT